jgi:hypothetical protein
MNGPFMLAAPSYVMSPNRLTIPVIITRAMCGLLPFGIVPSALSADDGVNGQATGPDD